MVYIPGISESRSKRLERRKGGGGKGGGGGKSGGSSGSSGSSGGTVGSRGASVPVSGSTVGRSSAVSYGAGSTKVVTIPQGQPFAGRTSGGGTRDQVYGNRAYGSGFPGTTGGLGVGNRNFPFVYWPLVWGGGLGYGAAYLHNHEYGDPNNSSRPGGPQTQAAFFSNTTNSTFHVVSDNSTVVALIASISANCTFASNSSKTPSTFNGAATDPLPEQAIQYYRASSVVLTLDGYNDTVALTGAENAIAPPLPSNVDQTLLDCLNSTIGAAVPLFEDAASSLPMPSVGLVGLVYVLWCLSSFF